MAATHALIRTLETVGWQYVDPNLLSHGGAAVAVHLTDPPSIRRLLDLLQQLAPAQRVPLQWQLHEQGTLPLHKYLAGSGVQQAQRRQQLLTDLQQLAGEGALNNCNTPVVAQPVQPTLPAEPAHPTSAAAAQQLLNGVAGCLAWLVQHADAAGQGSAQWQQLGMLSSLWAAPAWPSGGGAPSKFLRVAAEVCARVVPRSAAHSYLTAELSLMLDAGDDHHSELPPQLLSAPDAWLAACDLPAWRAALATLPAGAIMELLGTRCQAIVAARRGAEWPAAAIDWRVAAPLVCCAAAVDRMGAQARVEAMFAASCSDCSRGHAVAAALLWRLLAADAAGAAWTKEYASWLQATIRSWLEEGAASARRASFLISRVLNDLSPLEPRAVFEAQQKGLRGAAPAQACGELDAYLDVVATRLLDLPPASPSTGGDASAVCQVRAYVAGDEMQGKVDKRVAEFVANGRCLADGDVAIFRNKGLILQNYVHHSFLPALMAQHPDYAAAMERLAYLQALAAARLVPATLADAYDAAIFASAGLTGLLQRLPASVAAAESPSAVAAVVQRLAAAVAAELDGEAGADSSDDEAGSRAQRLAAQLADCFMATHSAAQRWAAREGLLLPSGWAPALLRIASGLPALHAPLLRLLWERSVDFVEGAPTPTPAGRGAGTAVGRGPSPHSAEGCAALAALLLHVAGVREERPAGDAGCHSGAAGGAALSPAFLWQVPAGIAACGAGDGGGPRGVPGPVWLQRLWAALPLQGRCCLRVAQLGYAYVAALQMVGGWTVVRGEALCNAITAAATVHGSAHSDDGMPQDEVFAAYVPASMLHCLQWLNELLAAATGPDAAMCAEALCGLFDSQLGCQLAAAAGPMPLPFLVTCESSHAARGRGHLLPLPLHASMTRLMCALAARRAAAQQGGAGPWLGEAAAAVAKFVALEALGADALRPAARPPRRDGGDGRLVLACAMQQGMLGAAVELACDSAAEAWCMALVGDARRVTQQCRPPATSDARAAVANAVAVLLRDAAALWEARRSEGSGGGSGAAPRRRAWDHVERAVAHALRGTAVWDEAGMRHAIQMVL